MAETKARITALDLFAGTGWGVACKRLGVHEKGVEIMDAAVETRTANGMETIYRDVWEGLDHTAEEYRALYGSYQLLIASPPCQTFSMAGNGAGRRALDDVVEAIETHAYKDAAALRAFGDKHDPRTALVLTPLAHVWRDRPKLVAMEQVPTVLPVWEACAVEMRKWGYQVQVEVLNAEQYGVPQTRKRAILVARRGGPVHLPAPTHSRYYPRTPDKLDPGVLKWVSMAEALGWGMTDRPMPTITGGAKGMTDRWASGGNSVRKMIDGKIGGPDWVDPEDGALAGRVVDKRQQHDVRLDVPEVAALQTYPPTARGLVDRPSPTITGGGTETGGAEPIAKLARYTEAPGWTGSQERLSTDEAAALQTYPPTVEGWGYTDRPAPTVMGGAHGASGIELFDQKTRQAMLVAIDDGRFTPHGRIVNPATPLDVIRMVPAEAAVLQSYPPYVAFTQNNRQANQARRTLDQPAPTVTAGHDSTNRGFFDEDGGFTIAEPEQVAALQTYPEPLFVWCGSKSKKFLQIGNAVPPLLAEAVLAALIGIRPGR